MGLILKHHTIQRLISCSLSRSLLFFQSSFPKEFHVVLATLCRVCGWLVCICTRSVKVLCQLGIPCLQPPCIRCGSLSSWLPELLSSLASWSGVESISGTEGPKSILLLSKGHSKAELLVFGCRSAPLQSSPSREWSFHPSSCPCQNHRSYS